MSGVGWTITNVTDACWTNNELTREDGATQQIAIGRLCFAKQYNSVVAGNLKIFSPDLNQTYQVTRDHP